jgi:cell division protein ZapA
MTQKTNRISLGRSPSDSTGTPTIRVEIYNQTYNIRSEGDGEYISQLAEFVDSRMREISSGTLTVDSLKVAILAALHIADELHRTRRLHEQSDAQLASRSSECAEMLDRVLRSRQALDKSELKGPSTFYLG